jgi:hypothetical protein
VLHGASGTRFTVTGLQHRLERGATRVEHRAAYYIGSGREGHSFLVQVGDHLFQSPVSYYARQKRWDVSPGYAQEKAPDFSRPVTTECLFCHAGRARPVEGTLNRYQNPPFQEETIGCGRCHGPAEAHLARPSRDNIVNPRRLAPRQRDSVCEQCHLAGEARIPNPGRRFEDFRPGMALEEVFVVYVSGRDFRVTSHTEQFALSACARASGDKLWCGTCHDPHGKTARRACVGCHEAAHRKSEDCVACHMPRREPTGVPHTVYTDHRIGGGTTQPPRLRAWRELPGTLAQRGLGLAYVSVGERDQSAEALQEGFRLLVEVQKEFDRDPAVLTALGLVLMRKGAPSEAARLFEEAVRQEPQRAVYHLNLANAWQQAGEPDRATPARNKALVLDPLLERWAVR